MKIENSTSWGALKKETVNSTMPVSASHMPTKTFEPRFSNTTSKIEVQNPRVGFAPVTETKPVESTASTNQIKTGQKIDILA